MEKEIKGLLYELEIPVIQRSVQKSPTYTVIHYDLVDIKQLTQVEKKVKFLSAYLHKDILYRKSNISHFALAVPNEESRIVDFYDKEYNFIFNKKFSKPRNIFAGVDENNIPQVINLDELPHILVSGTTGSGKSVVLNNIICSLLRNSDPQNKPKFSMIDTKRVELCLYKEIDEDLCKVVCDIPSAIELLEDICCKIDARYIIMENTHEKIISEVFPREIVIIEELGDLMMGSKGKVEDFIVKIARLGRACGIHLIISTQRPTVKVVTGEIKANIGCRFALQTTSAVDSRNILGKNGAELLKGKGDCLLKLPNKSDEIHLQCPYITDEDIVKCIKKFMGE